MLIIIPFSPLLALPCDMCQFELFPSSPTVTTLAWALINYTKIAEITFQTGLTPLLSPKSVEYFPLYFTCIIPFSPQGCIKQRPSSFVCSVRTKLLILAYKFSSSQLTP